MWPGVVEFLWTAKLKKGIKIYRQCRLTSFAKRALGLIFHVVVVQLSLIDWAELSFLVVNPATVLPSRYLCRLSFAFSL